MQEKKKKAGEHKIKKKIVKQLPDYLAFSYFQKYCPTHTKELRQNNPVEFIVTYTPTVTSTDQLLLVFHFAWFVKHAYLTFTPLIGSIVSPK